MDALLELMKMNENVPYITNTLYPHPSSSSVDEPVAFISGIINLKKSLRYNGNPVDLGKEIKTIEELVMKEACGEVIDLTKAAADMQINSNEIQEKEIKENWSKSDEKLFQSRGIRQGSMRSSILPAPAESKNSLSDDIDALLRAAEAEEEFELPVQSKVSLIKNESKSALPVKLPKRATPLSDSLIGDIVERNVNAPESSLEDSVAKRVIMNELRTQDLRSSASETAEPEERKISKFKSLRK